MDIPQNTISIYAEATPKTYVEGMSAVFSVDTGEETREYPAELGAGNRFFAEIVCPLTDTTLVSVVFITGEKRETQLLKDYMGLYNASFPTVSVDSHFLLLWKELDGEGNLVFDERNGDNYAWRQKMISTPYENGIEPAALREVKVGLFKNQELVAWMEPCEQPSHYQGDWDAEQFYRMPDMTIRPEREDVFTIGTLIIDEYGRERLEIESPYSVDEKGEELTHSENFVKADWFDTSSGWKY